MKCAYCNGEGCYFCNYTGDIIIEPVQFETEKTEKNIKCTSCNGTGCAFCHYQGFVKEEK